jgi:hypothetical protein
MSRYWNVINVKQDYLLSMALYRSLPLIIRNELFPSSGYESASLPLIQGRNVSVVKVKGYGLDG